MSQITFNENQLQIINAPVTRKMFVSGPAGSGKTTTAVQRLKILIDDGIPAEKILILVPQRSLAGRFYDFIQSSDLPAGGFPSILTIGGLAQRMIALFWPVIAKNAGFASPTKLPQFLTLETAQYFLSEIMAPLLQKGYFESVTIDVNRLYSQIIDNLNKSAVVGFPVETISERLTQAWAGKPSQTIIYKQAQECAELFRVYCLQNNLLDFSLQLKIFADQLFPSLIGRSYLRNAYSHLIYDNAEEDYPVAHDIIREWLPDFESVLVLSDLEGGFRSFLGADTLSANSLSSIIENNIELSGSFTKSVNLDGFESALNKSLIDHRLIQTPSRSIQKAFSIHSFRFYPQVMDWVGNEIGDLLKDKQVLASDISILTPFLSDSLRFDFTTRLTKKGIPIGSFRPSRSLRDEPVVRALVNCAKLAHPEWKLIPSKEEVRTTFLTIFEGSDLIRADLLTQMLYSTSGSKGTLKPFTQIKTDMQVRVSYTLGEKYEIFRKWIDSSLLIADEPLDIFFSTLFGEVLSQPGFVAHNNYDQAVAINRLIESSRKFRLVKTRDLNSVDSSNREYLRLIEEGVIASQYLSDWNENKQESPVLISPAYSFLMNNRVARFQFWLDIGSQGWWSRLDQPLTQPYVLNRNWQKGKLWTDSDEYNTNQLNLARLTTGLIRRCSGHVYLCSLGVNEQGNEERGSLLMAIQTILRTLKNSEELSDV